MLLSLAALHFTLSLLQRNSLAPSPSPPDTHCSLSALLPPFFSQTDTSSFQYSDRSPPHAEPSPRCTFLSSMDKREAIWRTWFLCKEVVYPVSPLYGLWQETLIQEKTDLPSCPSGTEGSIALFLPSPQGKDQPADGVQCWPWGFLFHITVIQEAKDPPWGEPLT